MAEVVNLRQFRKQQRRREAEKAAETNRARHGSSKAEREKQRRESEKARRDLDGKRLD